MLLASKPGKESRRVVAVQARDLRQKNGGYVSTVWRRMLGGTGDEARDGITDHQVGTPG